MHRHLKKRLRDVVLCSRLRHDIASTVVVSVDPAAGEITLRWKPAAVAAGPATDIAADVQERASEAAALASLQTDSPASRGWLRKTFPQAVSYEHVSCVWGRSRKDIPTQRMGDLAINGAWVRIVDRLGQILRSADPAELHIHPWRTADGTKTDHLVMRVGIDGTRRWTEHLEHVAINVHQGHAPANWRTVGVLYGHETLETVEAFFRATTWREELQELQTGGLRVELADGRWLPVLPTTNADHISRILTGQCDGSGSRKDDRHLCPYCDLCPTVCPF